MLLIFGGVALIMAVIERYLERYLVKHPEVLQKLQNIFRRVE